MRRFPNWRPKVRKPAAQVHLPGTFDITTLIAFNVCRQVEVDLRNLLNLPGTTFSHKVSSKKPDNSYTITYNENSTVNGVAQTKIAAKLTITPHASGGTLISCESPHGLEIQFKIIALQAAAARNTNLQTITIKELPGVDANTPRVDPNQQLFSTDNHANKQALSEREYFAIRGLFKAGFQNVVYGGKTYSAVENNLQAGVAPASGVGQGPVVAVPSPVAAPLAQVPAAAPAAFAPPQIPQAVIPVPPPPVVVAPPPLVVVAPAPVGAQPQQPHQQPPAAGQVQHPIAGPCGSLAAVGSSHQLQPIWIPRRTNSSDSLDSVEMQPMDGGVGGAAEANSDNDSNVFRPPPSPHH